MVEELPSIKIQPTNVNASRGHFIDRIPNKRVFVSNPLKTTETPILIFYTKVNSDPVTVYYDEQIDTYELLGGKDNIQLAVDDITRKILGSDDTEPKQDSVHHPGHYTSGDIECIDAIKASMTPEEFEGYCKGNFIKYVWRYREKNGLEDLEKANVYLNWLINSLKGENLTK